MAIRAVVFDIGGVLEITPWTGWVEKWEGRLHLNPGELDERLIDVWRAGSLGTISQEEVEKRIGEIMGMDQGQVAAFLAKPNAQQPHGLLSTLRKNVPRRK